MTSNDNDHRTPLLSRDNTGARSAAQALLRTARRCALRNGEAVCASPYHVGTTMRTTFHGRRATTIENDALRLTVLDEGGHIAEVFHKPSGISPLWIPRWTSIEPSEFDSVRHPDFGSGPDAKLLAGIMGHNLCLDIFGGPSAEESDAGLTAHGEASIARYTVAATGTEVMMEAVLAMAALSVQRTIALHDHGVRVVESVENLTGCDRPVGWTEHVTLGPPFLKHGATQCRSTATRSKVFEGTFGIADVLQPAAEFDWPFAPGADGARVDLRVYNQGSCSSAYSAHLMDRERDDACFVAYAPEFRCAFGYVWKRSDFPWMGIWDENRSRSQPPWNSCEVTRGMEFGVSPFPETRRQMIERGSLFGVPTFRWIPARRRVEVEYWIIVQHAEGVPERLAWPERT